MRSFLIIVGLGRSSLGPAVTDSQTKLEKANNPQMTDYIELVV